MAVAKVILNGTTLIDVTQDTVTSANLLEGNTATKNDGTKVTGTYVAPQSNDFVVTLSYNETTEMWEPDCTYAEVTAAYNAGKEIVVVSESPDSSPADGYYVPDVFQYTIAESSYDSTLNIFKNIVTSYILDANGLTIDDIVTYIEPSGTISINSSGTTDVTNYAFASVAAGSATTPATTITANPTISVGNNGLVTVSVSSSQNVTPTVSSGYITVGTPGTITVSGSNNSQLSVQAAATITPSESSQVAVASGKYTTGAVTVGAISSNYIGSNIPQKTSADLSASGSAVIVPSGYYAAAASKNIDAGALYSSLDVTFAPSFSIQTGGIIKVQQSAGGQKYPIQTAGYFDSTAKMFVGCTGSSTYQLDTQAAATITPTESEQTAVAANKYTLGIVKVGAISSTYIGSGVTQNDSSDLIVSNAVVTVPSGYYAAAASTLVPDSFTISDVSNTTGITAEISAGNGGGGSGLTSHGIYLEFNDSTSTNIEVDYDDSLIGAMITNYAPTGWTYNNKTITLAQLDGITWYNPAVIPLNTQLIDYTACESNKAINSEGEVVATEWYYTSDFTAIEAGMVFSYKCSLWHYIAFYDSTHAVIDTIYVYTDGTQDPNDSNTGYGTLSGNKIPSNAAYVRLCGTWYDSDHISLIRTA